jgi:hypothetical protein
MKKGDPIHFRGESGRLLLLLTKLCFPASEGSDVASLKLAVN